MVKKKISIIVLLVLLVAGGVAFFILSQPPKEQLSDKFKEEAATKILGRKAQLNESNVPTGDTEYKGKYISFKYPAKALVYAYKDPSFESNNTRLEDFSFDLKDPTLVFNLQVLENSTNLASIDDYPSVRLRSNPANGYTGSVTNFGTVVGKSFFMQGSSPEKSGFFLRSGKIYSISVTGSSVEGIEQLYDAIVRTVSFVPAK